MMCWELQVEAKGRFASPREKTLLFENTTHQSNPVTNNRPQVEVFPKIFRQSQVTPPVPMGLEKNPWRGAAPESHGAQDNVPCSWSNTTKT